MVFLYRAIVAKEDPRIAYDSVTRIWAPEGPWKQLIHDQLAGTGSISSRCSERDDKRRPERIRVVAVSKPLGPRTKPPWQVIPAHRLRRNSAIKDRHKVHLMGAPDGLSRPCSTRCRRRWSSRRSSIGRPTSCTSSRPSERRSPRRSRSFRDKLRPQAIGMGLVAERVRKRANRHRREYDPRARAAARIRRRQRSARSTTRGRGSSSLSARRCGDVGTACAAASSSTPNPRLKIDRIDHIVLTVRDIEATCEFYARVLRHGRRHLRRPAARRSSSARRSSICMNPARSSSRGPRIRRRARSTCA